MRDDDQGPEPADATGMEEAVDAMEHRVLGSPEGDEPENDDAPAPAFDIDLDPERQGAAEAASEDPG